MILCRQFLKYYRSVLHTNSINKQTNTKEWSKQIATLVSSMTAQRICVFCMAIFRLSRVSWWYSCVPWEKLNLATFMPALSSFSNIGTDLDDGPRVHTIFVFGMRPSFGNSFKSPSMSMFAICPASHNTTNKRPNERSRPQCAKSKHAVEVINFDHFLKTKRFQTINEGSLRDT